MNARNKLNVAYFNGCLILAAIVGVAAQSFPALLTTLAALAACGVACGNIRLRPGRR
ncbi:hypothetical protein [Paludisphaera soli]|uniref:hypothetical protein n=1 Tax=Paludisphaera soli TaxID=2712865 RepID=UPI0013EE0CF6|nr:hypothetical protein [Paludisphaera soli]